MARVVVDIPDSVDLSKVNDIKLYIRYCKDNDEYSYVTDGFSIQEERPQEWIKKQVTPASCIYVCSKCGTKEVILSNFCRECGSDMRGKRRQ